MSKFGGFFEKVKAQASVAGAQASSMFNVSLVPADGVALEDGASNVGEQGGLVVFSFDAMISLGTMFYGLESNSAM
jgi:hypothetical protein